MQSSVRAWVLGLFIGAAALALGGCDNYSRRVELGLGDRVAIADPSVTVHLVGVVPGNLEMWKNYSMTEYWSTSQYRQPMVESGSVKAVQLGGGRPKAFTLERNDPMWDEWKKQGAEYLLVLSDWPRSARDMPGSQDQRRRIFPLLFDQKPINLLIEPTGLVVTRSK